MKKPLLAGFVGILLITLTATTLYAQVATGGASITDKMKAVAHAFTLSSILNPTDTGLTSDPIKGKKTGDILTAGEYNRILELVSEGGGGAGDNSSVKAWVTYRNLNGVVTTIGNAQGIQSITNGTGVTNFLNYDTIITLKEPLLDGDYAVFASPAFNSGSGYYNGSVLDWVCVWSKISATSLGVHCAYPGYGAYGNSIVSVAVIGKGGSSLTNSSSSAFYYCTNAQSLDSSNAPCYGAAQNQGLGDGRYRVVSCHIRGSTGHESINAQLLNFGRTGLASMQDKWNSLYTDSQWQLCIDGSVLVVDTQGGGGSPGGASWVDVPLTDTASYDHNNCQYRFKLTGPNYASIGTYGFSSDGYYNAYYTTTGLIKGDSGIFIKSSNKNVVYVIDNSNNSIVDVTTAWGWRPTKIEKLCGGGSSGGTFGTAWVNFDGTQSTIVMKGASGIASVTKVSTGNYQVNFTTPRPNTDYGVICTSGPSPAYLCFPHSKTTTGVLIKTSSYTTNTDAEYVSIVIQ